MRFDRKIIIYLFSQEYTKETVQVYPLGVLEPLNSPSQSVVPLSAAGLPNDLTNPVKATVYIWSDSISRLVPELWSFDTFVRDNAWKWVGATEEEESYAEVDRRREMNGIIARDTTPAGEASASPIGLSAQTKIVMR